MARSVGVVSSVRGKKIRNIKRFRPAGMNQPLTIERKEVRQVAIGFFANTFAIGERANAANSQAVGPGDNKNEISEFFRSPNAKLSSKSNLYRPVLASLVTIIFSERCSLKY